MTKIPLFWRHDNKRNNATPVPPLHIFSLSNLIEMHNSIFINTNSSLSRQFPLVCSAKMTLHRKLDSNLQMAHTSARTLVSCGPDVHVSHLEWHGVVRTNCENSKPSPSLIHFVGKLFCWKSARSDYWCDFPVRNSHGFNFIVVNSFRYTNSKIVPIGIDRIISYLTLWRYFPFIEPWSKLLPHHPMEGVAPMGAGRSRKS